MKKPLVEKKKCFSNDNSPEKTQFAVMVSYNPKCIVVLCLPACSFFFSHEFVSCILCCTERKRVFIYFFSKRNNSIFFKQCQLQMLTVLLHLIYLHQGTQIVGSHFLLFSTGFHFHSEASLIP